MQLLVPRKSCLTKRSSRSTQAFRFRWSMSGVRNSLTLAHTRSVIELTSDEQAALFPFTSSIQLLGASVFPCGPLLRAYLPFALYLRTLHSLPCTLFLRDGSGIYGLNYLCSSNFYNQSTGHDQGLLWSSIKYTLNFQNHARYA